MALEIFSFILLIMLLNALAARPNLLSSASVFKILLVRVCHRWSYGFLKWFKSRVLPSSDMYGVSLSDCDFPACGGNSLKIPWEYLHHRHREQTCGRSGEWRSWDELRELHWNIYITTCKIDSQWKFAVGGRGANRGLGDSLAGWEGGGRFQRKGTCVYFWLIHIDGWQKPTQHCRAIILQLKINCKIYPEKSYF